MHQRTEENQRDVDLDLLDALGGLIARLLAEGEQLAKDCGVPVFFIKALHLMDGPLAMKELGQRMHCDPFVRHQHRGHDGKAGTGGAGKRPGRPPGEAACPDRRRPGHEAPGGTGHARALAVAPGPFPEERLTLISLIHKMAPPLSATDPANCPAKEVTSFLAVAATPPVG